jgi:hypothetical protein
MAIKDSLEIYKLLVMRIPLLNSQNPDDMALSLELAKKFYNKAAADLPPEIGLILSPMEVDPISFEKHATSDTNAIADSYENLMEQAGVSQIFDARRLTGATSVKMSMMVDAMTATKGIVQQVESFVNEWLLRQNPSSKAYVKFIDVTTYTRDERIAQTQKAAEMGMPVKLELMSLLGYDALESISSDWLESKLGLSVTRFVHPLVSSHTQNNMSDEGGAPTSEESGKGLTDEGEKTRDLDRNDN